MTLGCAKLDQQVADYLAWDQNVTTRSEIQKLLDEKNVDGLKARMNTRLVFGTAGVRAPMQAGFGRLNDLTIIQITHGFARHMLNVYGQPKTGVAIGFDGRHNSRRFAELAANVFIRNNIPVYFFSEVSPTPVVSWATINLGCDAGLIITASHNPKEDNGYKAYWSNGAQIIGPHDDEIVRIKEAEPQPREEYWDLSELKSSPLFHSADVVIDPYFAIEKSNNFTRDINTSTPLKFTYSAFHGIGYHYAKRMFTEFGFPASSFISVAEQQEPNPDFPTIPFPNPEEGRKVLTLSLETAEKNGSTVILANDPDADRIQLAEKQKDGEWRVFTGNEMGALLTWWIWTNWRKANPNVDASKVYILNSAVSSQIVKTIADAEGLTLHFFLAISHWRKMANPARDGYLEFANEPELPGEAENNPPAVERRSTLSEDSSLFQDRLPTENSITPEQAFIHMVKAMLGTGLLSLPLAFKHSGLFLGLILTIVICLICLYCMRQVVFAAHFVCNRNGRDLIDYANIMRGAVEMGPPWIKRRGYFFKQLVNVNMFISQLGFCCVYFVFMADNLEDASEVLRSLDAFKFRLRRFEFFDGTLLVVHLSFNKTGHRPMARDRHWPSWRRISLDSWTRTCGLLPARISSDGFSGQCSKGRSKVFATVDDLKAALEVSMGFDRRRTPCGALSNFGVRNVLRACVKARGSNFEILL
uniref:Phosphoglucomutase-2 n=1 Tax=Caenorhabditis japonica TaxID=281687 RepID=A0A8R1EJ50_CAEJA